MKTMHSYNTQLFEEDFKLVRQCAAEGMVLLKNDDGALPFAKGCRVALRGEGNNRFIKGGGGSAEVISPYTKSLTDGLNELVADGRIVIDDTAKTVLMTITRNCSEGWDRRAEPGDFYLTDEEIGLFASLESDNGVDTVVVILNIPAVIDVRWISQYSKIKAVVIAWMPGMEGGSAVCDLLCGDKNPSGRLTDTFAADYTDYPSTERFFESETYVPYEEDIFVGYRYFETVDAAKQRVIYPFGYGLSYTEFEFRNVVFSYTDTDIVVTVDVENVGGCAGKEVVQLYSHSPEGKLEKPEVELRGFAKTGIIQPGETETLSIRFSIESMASFDDTGVTGYLGAYVLEAGVYDIYIAKNVREREQCGSLFVDEITVTQQLSLKLTGLPRRMRADGSLYHNVIGGKDTPSEYTPVPKPERKIMLREVADDNATIEQFLAQLEDDELINLLHAQPPTFPRGTAGIGNLKKYGVPSAQTADGPSGLRKSTPTTCFPCSTLVGCTWNSELQFAVGSAIGFEGITTHVDILLAPGLNIHRNPLCGRNFEYFSEDPLVAGRAAAAIVRGVQSQGMCATIKHFAANSKETNRMESCSLMTERALREIYLKGFEIAVREAKPCCVMSSYNLINGIHTSENYNLLTGILRDEWGFEGMVMTDWRNHSHQWREIIAGNNVKMPFGYPEELALTGQMLQKGSITRTELEAAAVPVLRMIMKTDIFRRGDMGVEYSIRDTETTHIKAVEFTGVSATFCAAEPCLDADGGMNMCEMGKDMRNQDTYLIYDINIKRAGDYSFAVRTAGAFDRSFIELTIDNKTLCELHFTAKQSDNPWQDWQTLGADVTLPEGEHILRLWVHSFERDQGININWFEFTPKK